MKKILEILGVVALVVFAVIVQFAYVALLTLVAKYSLLYIFNIELTIETLKIIYVVLFLSSMSNFNTSKKND